MSLVGQTVNQNNSHVIFLLVFEMLLHDANTIYGVFKRPNLTFRVSNSQNVLFERN